MTKKAAENINHKKGAPVGKRLFNFIRFDLCLIQGKQNQIPARIGADRKS